MNRFKEDEVVPDDEAAMQSAGDAIDPAQFSWTMAWAGTGVLWSMVGGVPASKLLAR